MKSKLLLLISMLVIASMLVVSCTTDQTTEAPEVEEPVQEDEEPVAAESITISFWNGLGSPENVVLNAMVAEFNETNEYGITVELTELDWATLYSKIVLDFATGSAPDVLTMHQTNPGSKSGSWHPAAD